LAISTTDTASRARLPHRNKGDAMSNTFRRGGRADRRRSTAPYTGEERRSAPPTTLKAYSQVLGPELQVYVQDPIMADNLGDARETLLAHARRADKPVLVLDLQKCTFLDTPGLSLLFELKKAANARGQAFYIQNPARAVLRMLNITRMIRVFPIRNTENSDAAVIPAARNDSDRSLDVARTQQR
jgi:anti-anti-sigma factor